MNRTVSVSLDAVRFLAASVVLLGHLSGARFTGGFLWQTSRFMQESVVVFFVLSGFVISHAVGQRDGVPGAYVVSRASRILSVAAPAVLVTFVLDAVGRMVAPGLYTATWGYQADHRLTQILANLLFVNQLWFLDVPPGSDLPYWSLGFEVWYYVIFGLVFFRRPGWAALACLVAGPKILCMFPLWLLGVATHRLCRSDLVAGRVVGASLLLGALLLWALAEASFWRSGWPSPSLSGQFSHLELPRSYVVGLLFSAALVGLHAMSGREPWLSSAVERPIRWLAGATFSLYLFHLPVAQFLTSVSPWPASSPPHRIIVLVGTVAILFLLAQVTERRREPWRRAIATLLPSSFARVTH